jgi:hypothetical protein
VDGKRRQDLRRLRLLLHHLLPLLGVGSQGPGSMANDQGARKRSGRGDLSSGAKKETSEAPEGRTGRPKGLRSPEKARGKAEKGA